jgi:hypothetical protein
MSPWETLGLTEGASPAEVKKAWRKLALKHHPDRNPGDPQAEDRFKALQSAYSTLTSGRGVPVSPLQGEHPSDDWLDTLAWMTEFHGRVVLDALYPRYIAEYGFGYTMVWKVREALEHQELAKRAPTAKLGKWTLWRLRRRLRHVDFGICENRWASGLVSLRKTHKGSQLLLEAHAFWRHVPREEDELRRIVFRTVELGLAGAVPLALGLRLTPSSLEQAQEADRLLWKDQRLWRSIWGAVAVLAVVLVGTAWFSQN